jgi:hypothetical protein
MRLLVALVTFAVLFIAACGSADDGGSNAGNAASPTATTNASPSPAASPAVTGIEHPTGASELVLLIENTGGLTGAYLALTALPVVAVYGDGTVLSPDAGWATYPGPALAPVWATRLTEEGVQAILAEAEAAGLLGDDAQYTDVPVSDAPTTRFTVNAGGRTTRVAAYALGFESQLPNVDVPDREARAELQEFVDQMTDLPSWLPPAAIVERDVPYEPERLQVISQAADESADPAVETGELDWPLATPLPSFGEPYLLARSRCAVVEGADLNVLLPLLRDATAVTRWNSGGEQFVLYTHPLLPHEDGCVTP